MDASAVIAVLAESGSDASWVAAVMSKDELAAPAVMPFEVSEVLRRQSRAGRIEPGAATAAHRQLLDLRVELWAHGPMAGRAWQLRDNASYGDACYVALAEMLDAPLVTLDRRLVRSASVSGGPRCAFLVPPAATGCG